MHGEGAQNFPNILTEIGEELTLSEPFVKGLQLKPPCPITPATPFPPSFRFKSFSKHQTWDYLLISF